MSACMGRDAMWLMPALIMCRHSDLHVPGRPHCSRLQLAAVPVQHPAAAGRLHMPHPWRRPHGGHRHLGLKLCKAPSKSAAGGPVSVRCSTFLRDHLFCSRDSPHALWGLSCACRVLSFVRQIQGVSCSPAIRKLTARFKSI